MKPLQPTEKTTDDYDALSGYWRQLETECKNKPFEVSSPNFNRLLWGERHWLSQPPISPVVLNESVKKCEEWLQENDF